MTWPAKWEGKTWAAGNHPRITERDLRAVYAAVVGFADPAKCFPDCGSLSDPRPATALRLLKREGLIRYAYLPPDVKAGRNVGRWRWEVCS